ncbi:MAG: nitroreductase family protein [Spirochaetes bacterium]|nr:nitroreductase family protein [Spirochaetota bacterium]
MKGLTLELLAKLKMGKETATFENLKPMLRPGKFQNGAIKINTGKCTGCGLCIQSCPFKCMEIRNKKYPQIKNDAICFSCSNCIVACPEDAISIGQIFCHNENSFFYFGNPPVKMPVNPKNANGDPDKWNEIERIILSRRSVRNFKNNPVPDHLIRRILEAGRFAPSGGNHQPWKFTVVTDPVFIAQMEESCQAFWAEKYSAFKDEQKTIDLFWVTSPGIFDTRTQYGIKCIALKQLPVFFNAPALIFIGGHGCMNDPSMSVGICGENMNIAAASLGLGACWTNFGNAVNYVPDLKSKLGFEEPWKVESVLTLGYPKFKQDGFVARHYRPVTWFRPGSKTPEIEE